VQDRGADVAGCRQWTPVLVPPRSVGRLCRLVASERSNAGAWASAFGHTTDFRVGVRRKQRHPSRSAVCNATVNALMRIVYDPPRVVDACRDETSLCKRAKPLATRARLHLR
jgi:hypothetical protein